MIPRHSPDARKEDENREGRGRGEGKKRRRKWSNRGEKEENKE